MLEEQQNFPEKWRLEPGELLAKVQERTQSALRSKALKSITTESELIEQEGIHFLVRSLPNLARKEAAKKQEITKENRSGQNFNPFLPYEEELFVANLSETHVCLLNKYNVVDHHLLIVTREFEEQESLLTLQDFEALQIVLTEFEGLAFYNGGKLAGASQRHKHLQVVPLPLTPSGPRIPIEPALAAATFQGAVGTVPVFPFTHAFMKLDLAKRNTHLAASSMFDCYVSLLKTVGVLTHPQDLEKKVGHYNLLITREWMLMIPRTQEEFQSISVNSLGFAGTFFVRNQALLEELKTIKPITILQNVSQKRRE